MSMLFWQYSLQLQSIGNHFSELTYDKQCEFVKIVTNLQELLLWLNIYIICFIYFRLCSDNF